MGMLDEGANAGRLVSELERWDVGPVREICRGEVSRIMGGDEDRVEFAS